MTLFKNFQYAKIPMPKSQCQSPNGCQIEPQFGSHYGKGKGSYHTPEFLFQNRRIKAENK